MTIAHHLTLAAAVALAITPAVAATEDDCKNAVAQTEREMESSAEIMMESGEVRDGWSERLLSASGDGVRGDPDRCIGRTNEVRDEAGLKPIE